MCSCIYPACYVNSVCSCIYPACYVNSVCSCIYPACYVHSVCSCIYPACYVKSVLIIILLLSALISVKQLILHRISEIAGMYICMYVSVHLGIRPLRNPIISHATHKRSITCTSVTLRNVTGATLATLYAHNAVAASLSTSLFVQCATD